jgi:hypothetical protein
VDVFSGFGNLLRLKAEGKRSYDFSVKFLVYLAELFQTTFHFLQAFEDVGVEVKLMCMWQGFLNHALEFIHVYMIVLYQKNKVVVNGRA